MKRLIILIVAALTMFGFAAGDGNVKVRPRPVRPMQRSASQTNEFRTVRMSLPEWERVKAALDKGGIVEFNKERVRLVVSPTNSLDNIRTTPFRTEPGYHRVRHREGNIISTPAPYPGQAISTFGY